MTQRSQFFSSYMPVYDEEGKKIAWFTKDELDAYIDSGYWTWWLNRLESLGVRVPESAYEDPQGWFTDDINWSGTPVSILLSAFGAGADDLPDVANFTNDLHELQEKDGYEWDSSSPVYPYSITWWYRQGMPTSAPSVGVAAKKNNLGSSTTSPESSTASLVSQADTATVGGTSVTGFVASDSEDEKTVLDKTAELVKEGAPTVGAIVVGGLILRKVLGK